MSLTESEEQKIIEVLAWVYRQVPWQKMRTQKIPWDVFNHRVRAAARQGTLFRFASKLANYFGLQHMRPEAISLLAELRPAETRVLNALYTEHVALCMLAVQRSKQIKEGNNDPEN